jgi:hypothetical protein
VLLGQQQHSRERAGGARPGRKDHPLSLAVLRDRPPACECLKRGVSEFLADAKALFERKRLELWWN